MKIVAISGSLRSGSYNRKVLGIAKKIAEGLGAAVVELDLRELTLPIYDGDFEAAGLQSENVKKLKTSIEAADVLLIASPEYNYGISGALKNALDWASRGGNSLGGKWAAIFGASPGIFGTLRGQFQLRQILTSLNVFVLPQPQVFLKNADTAFAPDGSLADPKTADQLKKLITQTIEAAKKFSGPAA